MGAIQTRQPLCWTGPVCPPGSQSGTEPFSFAEEHCSGSLLTG